MGPPCRVGFFGDSTVGKTQLFNRLKCDPIGFEDAYEFTIGIDCARLNVEGSAAHDKAALAPLNQSPPPPQLWDTAGQRRFRSYLSRDRFRITMCVLVFDITRRSSFDELLDIVRQLKLGRHYERRDTGDRPDPVLLLVGNKLDLIPQQGTDATVAHMEAAGNWEETRVPPGVRREVPREEAERVAYGELDADAYVEVSAKTGVGIEYLRRLILRCAPQPRSRVGAMKLPAAPKRS